MPNIHNTDYKSFIFNMVDYSISSYTDTPTRSIFHLFDSGRSWIGCQPINGTYQSDLTFAILFLQKALRFLLNDKVIHRDFFLLLPS